MAGESNHDIFHRPTPLRIMYIDDEEQLTRFIDLALRRAGHHVQTFTQPAHALDVLRRTPEKFDLVVTDALMPGVSGLDVSRAVKRIRSSLPVILVSGNISPAILSEAAKAGVTRVLPKPFRVGDLLETGPAPEPSSDRKSELMEG
jgi:DNA-binding NtrC family response regulator